MSSIVMSNDSINLNYATKILKSKDYQQFLNAQEVIQLSQKKAEEIILNAQECYEKEKKKGYEDGQNQNKLEQSDQMLKVVGRTINYLADVEQSLADIVISGVKKIMGQFDDEKLAIGLVHQALKQVRSEKQISIRVPTDQYRSIQKSFNEILSNYKGINFVDIIADPSLSTGDCLMESEIGVVDVSVDVQLAALKKRFENIQTKTAVDISDHAKGH